MFVGIRNNVCRNKERRNKERRNKERRNKERRNKEQCSIETFEKWGVLYEWGSSYAKWGLTLRSS